MPGNEVRERIHNFFGQEGLPQGQHQSQVVEGSWPGFSNSLLADSQRQIDSSRISNLKNYNAQQIVDPEGGQSSNAQHGLSFTQHPIRSEFSRNHLHNHQQPVNGYMHGNQVFQTMQSEANFLGMDPESGGHRLTSKGVPPDLHKIPMRLEMGESPVNYDFFGGQQQVNSQFPGMLQPLPRQQMGFNDMQLLQQQVMIKRLHESQMQQQLQRQQLEARQMNSFNQVAVNGNHLSGNHSHPLINGIPLHDVSNNSWQPELMTSNTNWLQCGISPVVQGLSSGLMLTPGQGQMDLTGSAPQQSEFSLYGVPVTGARASQNAFSAMEMNRLAHGHVSASSNSALVNQHTVFSSQDDIHESNMVPRPSYQEKLLFSHTSVQGSNNKLNFENLQQDDSHEGNNLGQKKFVEKQESTDPSERSCMKMAENMTAKQKVATLDPTEEKILFGSDDNLWDVFGNSTNMSSVGNNLASGSEIFGSLPSLQSGSWSALMQSAVAETSNENAGAHECGSTRQPVRADNNTDTRSNSQNSISAQHSGLKASIAQNEVVQRDATRTTVKYFQDKGSNFFNHGLSEKPIAEPSQVAGNMFRSSSSDFNGLSSSCPAREDEGFGDRLGIWKAAPNSNSAGAMEHKNFLIQNLPTQSFSSGFGESCAGNGFSTVRDVPGNVQQHLNKNSVGRAVSQMNYIESNQILESSASDYASKTVAEINGMGNSAVENSGDGFRCNVSPQTSAGGIRENVQVNARGSSFLPGGRQMQSGHVGRRPSIPRKFQYHPMGDVDSSDEPCREKVTNLPPTFQQVYGGNRMYFGESNSLGQTAVNRGMEKVSQHDLNCSNEVSQKGTHQDESPSTSGSVDRTVGKGNQDKSASRQTMLELLHKVDQSQGHGVGTSVSGLLEAKTSGETGSQRQHNQSSASQGFSLQLAPPSQPVMSPDNVLFSQSSLQAVTSNSGHNVSEKGGTSQSNLAPWSSNRSLHHQETHKGAFSGTSEQMNRTSGFPFSRGYQQNQLATRSSVNSPFEMSTSQVKTRDECGEMPQPRPSAQIPYQLNPTAHKNIRDSAEGYLMLEAMSASQSLVASSSSERGLSSDMMCGSQDNISMGQHQSWNQSSKPHPNILRSDLLSSNNLEARFSRKEICLEKTNQTDQPGGMGPSTGGNMMDVFELRGKDIAAKHASDAASVLSKMAQTNLQTLGRSFMQHNLSKEKNSLHPKPMVANGDENATNRAVNRGEDSIVDPKKLAHSGEHQSPPVSDGLVRDGSLHCMESVHLFGQTASKSYLDKNLVASAGPDHPQISPQLDSSWFSQYGTCKNGLVQPPNDACRSTHSEMAEQSDIVGRFADGLLSGQASKDLDTVYPGEVVKMQQRVATVPGAETLSSESLPHGATEQLLSVDRQKKRKTAMLGLVSFSKEVMQVSQRLQTPRETGVDWARATNRFAEKLEVENEFVEEVSPIHRSKRRLMLTTQLTQELFPPPPAIIMSLVANSNYETVVYTASRAALGDTCSAISTTGSETLKPPGGINMSPEQMKATEKTGDQYISKAAEDLNIIAQKLDSKFARLEKGITIPDLRVEVQDLEKISVMNRFAKFHVRGPHDGTENSSSSTDRTASSLRLYPQRYVTVGPMPRNVPDMVQCLSL